MLTFDKEDLKAIAKRRARVGVVKRLEFGFFGILVVFGILLVFLLLGVKMPKLDWILGIMAGVGVILIFVSSVVNNIRFKRVFKVLEQEAQLLNNQRG